MIVGGGGQLNLPPIAQIVVERDDTRQMFLLLAQDQLDVSMGETLPLLHQRQQLRVILQRQGINPDQVKPSNQVPIEVVTQQLVPTTHLVPQRQQLTVTWIGADHPLPIGTEEER